MQLVLLSGLSGSGKSVALKVLEDAGYFAVDNLPATLIPALLESLRSTSSKIAISIDARTGDTLDALPAIVAGMNERQLDCRVIFLEASDDALARRFSETRRPHPLAERVTGGGAAPGPEETGLRGGYSRTGGPPRTF